ncbi:hypothetical protein BU14_0562s0016 [Porphyra umbilicalis]|uniref:Uncharacterized protein n=1 Tax=Porphyra umbilicalis TaxID=2786 RepID=A0A1X6NRR4_PORUM|nr:hypothetical protein BU14_0562s0016 [Porphyra umbilicalis]|eukprot:OSX71304.1 hypothetical protein BU14_0562s0016 [Porphyra umbilicalis]
MPPGSIKPTYNHRDLGDTAFTSALCARHKRPAGLRVTNGPHRPHTARPRYTNVLITQSPQAHPPPRHLLRPTRPRCNHRHYQSRRNPSAAPQRPPRTRGKNEAPPSPPPVPGPRRPPSPSRSEGNGVTGTAPDTTPAPPPPVPDWPPPHCRLPTRVATHRCDRQNSSITSAAPSSRVAETAAACSRPKTLDREVQDASRDCSDEARHNHHHPCHSIDTDSPSAVSRSPKQATPLHHMPCPQHPPLPAAPTCGRRAPKRSHPCPRSPRPTRSTYTQTLAPGPPPPHAPRRRSATAQLVARLVAGTNATAETDAHSATTRPPV